MLRNIYSNLREGFYYLVFDKVLFPMIDSVFSGGTKNLEKVVESYTEPLSEIQLGQVCPSEVIYDMSNVFSKKSI